MRETTEYARHVVDLIREYDPEDIQKFPYAAHYVMGIAARKIERITAQLEQVTRERDAAVEDLSAHRPCDACSLYELQSNDCMRCRRYTEHPMWEWRGVEVE